MTFFTTIKKPYLAGKSFLFWAFFASGKSSTSIKYYIQSATKQQ